MKKIISISVLSLVFLYAIATGGNRPRWNDEYKIQVIQAAMRFIPQELQLRLPAGEDAVRQAVTDLNAFQDKKLPDPEKQMRKARELLQRADADPARLLAELVALTAYYMDAAAPTSDLLQSPGFRDSRAYARAKFDGYHRYADFAALATQIEALLDPHGPAWTEETDRIKLVYRAADAFNLYANVTADLWTALAVDAGCIRGSGQNIGLEYLPPHPAPGQDAFQPEEDMGFGFLCEVLLVQLREQGKCFDLEIGAAAEAEKPSAGQPEDEGFVFDEDEGMAVSEQEVQELGHSIAEIDSGGIDQSSGLDEEALAALNQLGIDMTQHKQEFKGIRGGVKPGETLKVGEVNYQIGKLSSVEIATLSERKVMMQLAGEAMGGEDKEGRMQQKIVAAVIGANVGGFKSCFERRLRVMPDLSGRVFLEFVIGVDGLVPSVRILENTTDDVDFAECLVRQMKRLRFPPPEGGEVIFVFPFIFEQAMNL